MSNKNVRCDLAYEIIICVVFKIIFAWFLIFVFFSARGNRRNGFNFRITQIMHCVLPQSFLYFCMSMNLTIYACYPTNA